MIIFKIHICVTQMKVLRGKNQHVLSHFQISDVALTPKVREILRVEKDSLNSAS